MDTSFINDPINKIKLVTLIVAICNIGFTGHSYLRTGTEEAYLACIIICFILTFLWAAVVLVGLLTSEHQGTPMYKKVELLVYICMFLFYVITLICFLVSLIDHGNKVGRLWERVIAFILGVVTTLLYGLIGYKLFQNAKSSSAS